MNSFPFIIRPEAWSELDFFFSAFRAKALPSRTHAFSPTMPLMCATAFSPLIPEVQNGMIFAGKVISIEEGINNARPRPHQMGKPTKTVS